MLTQEQFDARKAEFRAMLDGELEVAGNYKANKADWLDGRWSGFKAVREDVDDPRRGKTGVPADILREIAQRITTPPPGFHLHRTIQRFFDNRAKAVETGKGIDWATAEALAFGSLLIEGHRVRLSGQDVERGTFSQRHAVVIDQENEQRYTSLNSIREGQANLEVINSMLSEEAVLGFEYGYSLADPNSLVLWEAQFGDFANGAQVVIDQFISSGERKWLRMSGLTLLLPHGYEGQGPEHSSARLERFLQMCAEDNMQVANCTTPSNYFHILRRQLNREFRKPLVLMTPKSLLRHKRAVSNLDMLAEGSTFHRVLWDDAEHEDDTIKLVKDDKIRRVVLCSGKVYYDLYDEREKRGVNDVYLMRVEQLYPFPLKALANEMARFRNAEVVWCQEEPKNMGAWSFVDPYLEWVLGPGSVAGEAGALCRPPRLCLHGGRPSFQASGPAPGLPQRGAGGLTTPVSPSPTRPNHSGGQSTMATDILVPTLGESVSEATIGRWFKKPGDAVAADEPLVELETDKVTLEVNAPAAGELGEILVKDGETVEPGALLGSIVEGRRRRRRQGSRRQEDRDEGRHPHRRGDAEIRGRGQGARRGILGGLRQPRRGRCAEIRSSGRR